MGASLSLRLPSSRNARIGVISLFVLTWLLVLSVLFSSLQNPNGVHGVAEYVADSSHAILDHVRPGMDKATKAKLARLAVLEQEHKLYITNHARCDAHVSELLQGIDDKWGRTALDMSVGYEGSGVRVRRVAEKLVKGEKVVSATGGPHPGHHGPRRLHHVRPQHARGGQAVACPSRGDAARGVPKIRRPGGQQRDRRDGIRLL